MTEKDNGFSKDRYQKTVEDIRSLNKELSNDSVESLAREVLARVSENAHTNGNGADSTTLKEIEKLAHALISRDMNAGLEFVTELSERGIPAEDIFLIYLGSAARKLGEWWTQDKATFVDVTLGTSRIYAIMRAMAGSFTPAGVQGNKSAVFCTVPGETHSLGVNMAAELLRKKGWRIDLKIGLSHDELIESLDNTENVIIGLSGGGIHSVAAMARLVIALRINNPKARILVSGNVVAEAAKLIELMDVDAISVDFKTSEADLERLWQEIEDEA